MDDDKGWDRIVDAIDIKFGLEKHGKLSRPVSDAQNLTEEVRFIIFERDGVRYRMERVTGPAVLDKRSVGSRRIGGDLHMQTIYDPETLVHHTIVYRADGDDWERIDTDAFGV